MSALISKKKKKIQTSFACDYIASSSDIEDRPIENALVKSLSILQI